MGIFGTKRRVIKRLLLSEDDLEKLFSGEVITGHQSDDKSITVEVALEDIGFERMEAALHRSEAS